MPPYAQKNIGTLWNFTKHLHQNPPEPHKVSAREPSGTARHRNLPEPHLWNIVRNLVLKLHRIALELIWAKDPIAKFCCWEKKRNNFLVWACASIKYINGACHAQNYIIHQKLLLGNSWADMADRVRIVRGHGAVLFLKSFFGFLGSFMSCVTYIPHTSLHQAFGNPCANLRFKAIQGPKLCGF